MTPVAAEHQAVTVLRHCLQSKSYSCTAQAALETLQKAAHVADRMQQVVSPAKTHDTLINIHQSPLCKPR